MKNPKTVGYVGHKVLGYSRVSTKEQAVDSQALEQQQARLREEGKAGEILTDVLSGSRSDRPNFNRLMEMVRNREVDEVVCTRIDRLGRSLADLTQCTKVFIESGVNLRILDQQIDLSTPTGLLMANLLGALAQWETDLLSERVRHGKAYRRKQGLACESAPKAYLSEGGQYRLNQIPILCLLEERPENYRALSELKDEEIDITRDLFALTVADIAQDLVEIFLNVGTTRGTLGRFYKRYGVVRRPRKKSKANKPQSEANQGGERDSGETKEETTKEKDWPVEILFWTETGLRNWLTNPVLEGNTSYLKWVQRGKTRVRSDEPPQLLVDTHPEQALMTHEEAAYIRETFEIKKRMGGGSFIRSSGDTEPQYRPYAYLNGLAYCYKCGAKCRTKSAKKGAYSYFLCPHGGKGCDNTQAIAKEDLEQALIRELVSKSKALREQACDRYSSYRGWVLSLMDIKGVSAEKKRQFHLENQPKYEDLFDSATLEPPTSERLEDLEGQLAHLEAFPGCSAEVEDLKASLQEQITEEKQQLSSILNKSTGEIIFAGHRFNFWDTLPEAHKVEIYPRIVNRLFIQDGQLKQTNLKVEPHEEGIL